MAGGLLDTADKERTERARLFYLLAACDRAGDSTNVVERDERVAVHLVKKDL